MNDDLLRAALQQIADICSSIVHPLPADQSEALPISTADQSEALPISTADRSEALPISTACPETVIKQAAAALGGLRGKPLSIVTLEQPTSLEAGMLLSKSISKVGAFIGDLIEVQAFDCLREQSEYTHLGQWRRQPANFPDLVFDSQMPQIPGFEVKAWCPLASEITTRFEISQRHFEMNETHIVLLAWMPEFVIWGKPVICDLCVVPGLSLALARDEHFDNPPDYLVAEPTEASPTQVNVTGYRLQGGAEHHADALRLATELDLVGRAYSSSADYQSRVQQMLSDFPYRPDSNFAKLDRIGHPDIEAFKSRVMSSMSRGHRLNDWCRAIRIADEASIGELLNAA